MDNQQTPQTPQAAPETQGSKFGWGVLGFFIPLVGLILFLVWRSEKPRAAKASGIGAIIGFVVGIISSIIYSVAFASLLSTSMYY